MKHPGGKATHLYICLSMPFTFVQRAGGIRICCYRTVEPFHLFLGQKDVHLAQIPCIHIFIPGGEFAAGEKRNNNKAEKKKPQDFMQTLIPQTGFTLVFRLPLL